MSPETPETPSQTMSITLASQSPSGPATRQDITKATGIVADFSGIRIDPGSIIVQDARKQLNAAINTLSTQKSNLEGQRSALTRTQSDILKNWPSQKYLADTKLAAVLVALESNLPLKMEISKGDASFDPKEETFSCTVTLESRDSTWSGSQSYKERAPQSYLDLIPQIEAFNTQIASVTEKIQKARMALSNVANLRLAADAAMANQALSSSPEGQNIIKNLKSEVNIEDLIGSITGDELPSARYTQNYRQ